MPTNRFPTPWRIVQIQNGFVVSDAAEKQLAVFYGRTDPNTAGHTGFLTMDEARQLAVDFARLPELLAQNSEWPRRACAPTGRGIKRAES